MDKRKDAAGIKDQPITSIPFMRIRYVGLLVTGALLIASIISLATQGLNFGLDFTGGVLVEASRAIPFDAETVRNQVAAAGFDIATISTADDGATAVIRLPPAAPGEDVQALARRVTVALGDGVTILKADAVGPKVSGELLMWGIIATVSAVLAISIYIWFRFESRFGWAALITTFHDVITIAGLFSITRMTFDLTSIAAMLTIAGYSINDTVVVFDRIRETLKKYKKISLSEVIDSSITRTISRTVLTAGTTLITSLVMMLLGGPVLFGFAAAISFGLLVGTYSSIFVAAPLLIYLPGRLPGERAPEDESSADAAPAG